MMDDSSPTFKRTAAVSRKPVVLEAAGLVKTYGKRTVVDHVSFEVRQGEVVGLLGPNGAGKTTSFRMTCGLIPADGGTVWLDGNDVSRWPMYRRAREGRMGYLPQDRSLFASLTTEQNLYLPMELLGFSRAKQKTRSEELLGRFNLLHVRKTRVGATGTGGISGGEKRRLEIARALLSEPKILLLDEPFAALDPPTIAEIQSVVRELSADGIAILITDHQITATMQIAHYSYVISAGKVLCSGNPIDVLSNPEAQRVYFGEETEQQIETIKRKIQESRQEKGSGEDSAGKNSAGGVRREKSVENRSAVVKRPAAPAKRPDPDFVVDDADETEEEDVTFEVDDAEDDTLETIRPVIRRQNRRPVATDDFLDDEDEEIPPSGRSLRGFRKGSKR